MIAFVLRFIFIVTLALCTDAMADDSPDLYAFNNAMAATNTHAYFITSNSSSRQQLVQNFISIMRLDERHVTRVPAINRHIIPISKAPYFVENNWFGTWYFKGLVREGFKTEVMNPDYSKLRGRLALQLSVIRVMEMFIQSSYDNLIIFEDDIVLSRVLPISRVIDIAAKMIRLPRDEFDIAYFGYCYECANENEKSYQNATESSPLYVRARLPLCRHAILYSRRTINWYLKTWRPQRFQGGDEMLARLLCRYGLKKIRTWEPLFNQYSSKDFRDSLLGNYDEKDAFFNFECTRWWKGKCRTRSVDKASFQELSQTPPEDTNTIAKLFPHIMLGNPNDAPAANKG